MNKNKLRQICKDRAAQYGLPFNSILTHYFLEHVLNKIAQSRFSKNFIFKGGFLLSNFVGISNRTTKDIDLSLTGKELNVENIQRRFEEMLCPSMSANQEIEISIEKIEPIRDEDEYGGFRITILCLFENIRVSFPIDVATGDVVTPCHMEYSYVSFFGNSFTLRSYTTQTIIAEKLHTLYKKGIFNSRCKDFFDLYILYKLKILSLNWEQVLAACKNTFEHRKTTLSFDLIKELLISLEQDNDFVNRWNAFAKRNAYVVNLQLDVVLKNIRAVIDWIVS